MARRWPKDTEFTRRVLYVEDALCDRCGRRMRVCDHRHHRVYTFSSALHLVCKLARCVNSRCPNRGRTFSPNSELMITMPRWMIGWDVFCWLGHRRVARHWSVPQLRAELMDGYRIPLSEDAIEKYLRLYQQMLAARQQDPGELRRAYAKSRGLILSIDGLQPEKGHETLYVVRELTQKRVWFAEPLLSSAASEVRRLIVQARQWAEQLGKPVHLWMSDKQDAFLKGIAAEFPGVPHRYCVNHFLRDLAKPVLELDSRAKVKMRCKVRGLRAIEREALTPLPAAAATPSRGRGNKNKQGSRLSEKAAQVVLDYCATVRGILNDSQGGPLYPPGLRMSDALLDVRRSLKRNIRRKKGEPRNGCSTNCRAASTEE